MKRTLPLKILFLQKSTDLGGSKNCLVDTLRALLQHTNVEVEVLCSHPGQLLDTLHLMGVPTTLFSLPEWRRMKERIGFGGAIRKIAKAYRGRGFDWVISNEFWWAPHAAALAKALHCRSAVFIRDGCANAKKSRQYNLHKLDLISPSSIRIAQELERDPKIAPHVQVIYDTVQLPYESHRQEELRQILAQRPDIQVWLLSLGSIGPRKNQIAALQVLKELRRHGAPIGLVIAGHIEKNYTETFRAALVESNVANAVVLLGHFDDIYSLFAETHLTLLTSKREGCPRSLTETLLAGRAAFAFEVEGTLDIFGEESGRFVSRPDPKALAELITFYLNFPASYESTLERIRTRLETQFAPQTQAQSLLAALAPR